MDVKKNLTNLVTSPREALDKAWRVDDDIAAAWELIEKDIAFGENIPVGEIERLLQQFPSGFAISPEGEVFRIDKVMGYNPSEKQGLLVVKKLSKMYKDILNEHS